MPIRSRWPLAFLPSPGPAWRGELLAALSAVRFGLSTPLLQHWGAGVGPFWTAACPYAGAAALALATRRRPHQEVRLQRSDWPWLAGMALCGAVLAAVLLAWGLQRTSAASASLMLTLGAVCTAALAWLPYRETVDRRVLLAMALLLVASALLVLDAAPAGGAAALALGSRAPSGFLLAAGALMLAGVWLHLSERHSHPHHHGAFAHAHVHTNDGGHHHLHTHDPMPRGSHSHWHVHEPLTHHHPHVPDLHHQHRH